MQADSSLGYLIYFSGGQMKMHSKNGVFFPKEEIARRITNIRRKMVKIGIDVLTIFSGPGSLRYGQRGHVLYLSGYEPYFGDCMMILPGDDKYDPLLETDSADYFPEKTRPAKGRLV